MRTLSLLALTLLVLFASVLPTVLARETNADRLRRGYPPLPPSRREAEKRHEPSHHPRDTNADRLRRGELPLPPARRETEKRHEPSHRPRDTNADRFKRGDPPLPPARRDHHQPSQRPRDINADRLRRSDPPLPPARRDRHQPSQLPRDTNADRLRRGYPPLPPTRREIEKRTGPSKVPRDSNVDRLKRNYPLVVPQRPSQTVSGVLEIRDSSGVRQVGFVEDQQFHLPLMGMIDPSAPESSRLHATFSGDTHTVVANAAFSSPFFLGPDFFPDLSDPYAPPEEILITTVLDSSDANVWCYDSTTHELMINLPQPSGGTVPAVFVWDTFQNALLLVTDWPAFKAAAAQSEPSDKQPQVVRVFLADSS